MSTKIYDAYRIPKSEFPNTFIADVLKKFKDRTKEFIMNDKDFLKSIHYHTLLWLEGVKEDEERVEQFIDADFPYTTIYSYLEECEQQKTHNPFYMDIKLSCSVFEDKEYWYVKFFCNNRWQWNLLNEWEEEFDWFEDFHYQNQTDPPEDIPYEQFCERDEKWNELTGDEDSYVNGLQYVLMGAHQMYKMLTRSGWDDDIELAYDFTQGIETKDNDEEE